MESVEFNIEQIAPGKQTMPHAKPNQYWLKLRPSEVEKTFMQVVLDLQVILVLDGVDQIHDLPGFRIRSHDLYGPLPNAPIKDTGNRYPVLDEIVREAAKLIAMVRVRDDIAGIFGKCTFLLPTSTGDGALVGMRWRGRTVLAEAKSHWEGYHKLVRKAIGKLL